ncbi:MAG: BrnT family toxin [bacterium]|nr:BrnT family toxin [bacterium]
MGNLERTKGFQWDEGNVDKNWIRHRVSWTECEQVFFNQPLVVGEDWEHSDDEDRLYALGHTDAGHDLFVVFTLRGELIRVISAREMTPRERRRYEDARAEELEADPEV